jgi:hypothetical protein
VRSGLLISEVATAKIRGGSVQPGGGRVAECFSPGRTVDGRHLVLTVAGWWGQ